MSKLILAICLMLSINSLNLEDLVPYYTLNIGKVYTHGNNSITLVKANEFVLIHNWQDDSDTLAFTLEFKATSPEKTETLKVEFASVNLK
jgi:hypothetical protein